MTEKKIGNIIPSKVFIVSKRFNNEEIESEIRDIFL